MSEAKERAWFSKLRSVLREMPATVEIQVHQNFIQMNKAGERSATFERVGNADNVPEIDHFSTARVYPCSESA
ncbi:hypothetical protein G6L26_009880 [Agrobacterium radiobacter]|uniref:hypothetical protein n=1 Tax=Agrobacterium tumefaciens complex TaxID=1183400 RepID=UPI00080FF02F|nr:hypothetical protein [Agrobacterium tumefaciens]NTA05495.1 hypothetical protein [Agrobacterium tumefaciens]NTA92088.1 hypothetical protein [Agrobacterium tumefaciens]OCJ32241.1 hypothetical protein A6U90_10025 [Agrobacterium tumefaciens]